MNRRCSIHSSHPISARSNLTQEPIVFVLTTSRIYSRNFDGFEPYHMSLPSLLSLLSPTAASFHPPSPSPSSSYHPPHFQPLRIRQQKCPLPFPPRSKLTLRRISQPLRYARHCIAQPFACACYDIASRVGDARNALADGVACCAEGVTDA
jgi:hypothetical protein